jgi:hypothetical protein
MCDLREPPTHRRDENGKLQPISLQGHVAYNQDIAEHFGYPTKDQITIEGLYFVCATGAGYDYYDGEKWTGYDGLVFAESPTPSCGGHYSTMLQSINVSADLSRESLDELGRHSPYVRNVTFPIDLLGPPEELLNG